MFIVLPFSLSFAPFQILERGSDKKFAYILTMILDPSPPPFLPSPPLKKYNSLNPYSPMTEFFYKILQSGEVFNKMNIFGFIFEKK